jgi:hypothetical protein
MKLSRKFKHSININKMNDHLPPKIIEHNWNHNIHCILYWFSKEDSILSVFCIDFPKEDSILSVFCIDFPKEDSILSVFCQTGMFLLTLT